MPIYNPISLSLKNAPITVYNGPAPVGWTDLDLSAHVGLKRTLVTLAFTEYADISNNTIAVRTNGDVREYYHPTVMDGVAKGIAIQNEGGYTLLQAITDPAGIIEWRGSVNNNTRCVLISWLN